MGYFPKPIAHRPGDDKDLISMSNLLLKIAALAGMAGPMVVKFVPGTAGTAIGMVLTGIGMLATLNHPTPAAVRAFGDQAK